MAVKVVKNISCKPHLILLKLALVMTTPNPRPDHWSQTFLGRHEELQVLMSAWEQVRTGNGPQFVLLLGDTGLGKTRLVHEFYHRVSVEENRGRGSGYWPDQITTNFRSLEINPKKRGANCDIPWLWWGMRWQQWGLVRNKLDGEGLLSSKEVLLSHGDMLTRARTGRVVKGLALDRLLDLATYIPGVGQVLQVVLSAKGWKDYLHRLREHRETAKLDGIGAELEPGTPVSLFGERQNRDIEQLAMLYACAFLDPTKDDLPTIPFILVLDDAQGADPLTLSFIEKLYRRASAGGWRLLIVVTHWLKDWKEHRENVAACAPEGAPPQNVNELVERLFHQGRWLPNVASDPPARFHALEVGRLQECAALLALAYPGLAGPARDHVLQVAHNNPKLLVDFLTNLDQRIPEWAFEGQDRRCNLTPEGLRMLQAQPIEHDQILANILAFIHERHPHLTAALSLGSHQGMCYLHDVVSEVAARLRQQPSEARKVPEEPELREALEQADTRLNLVSNQTEPVASGEFREFVVQSHLKTDFAPTNPAQVRAALMDVLQARINEGRLPTAADAAGQIFQLLLTLLDEHLPAQPGLRRERLRTLARYVLWLEDQYLLQLAGARLLELDDALRQTPDVKALDLVAPQEALRLAQSLVGWCRYQSVALWCRAVEAGLATATDEASLRQVIWANILQGDAESHAGARAETRQRFEAALKLSQAIRQQFGDSPQALRDEALSLDRLGDIDWAEGQKAEARQRFEAALKLSQAIRQQFGDSPQALRDESVSLEKLGDIDWAEGQKAEARQRFEASLQLRQAIRQQFGDSPQALRDEALSLIKLGDIDWAEGQKAEARQRFEAALKLSQAIRQQFGDSPQALRDEAASWTKHAMMAQDDRRYAEALEALERALALLVQRLKDYPPLPEAVSDLIGGWQWAQQLAQQAGDSDREQKYTESLKALQAQIPASG